MLLKRLFKSGDILQKTQRVIVTSSLCFEPLATIFNWLSFILRKDMAATATQLAILSALKPVLTLLSFYLTSSWKKSAAFLKSNLLLTGLGARVPFLFFPFVENSWFFVLASPLYLMFNRARMPAWMELLKRNIDKEKREEAFSFGSTLGYAEGVLLAFGLGFMLDQDPRLWKLFIFAAAMLGIVGVFLQNKLPVTAQEEMIEEGETLSLKEVIVKPWKDTWALMKERKDFAHFQWSFMIAGFGIMLIIPIVPLFFVDSLHLSHLDNAFAKSVCMGLGFLLSTPFWTKALKKHSLQFISGPIFLSFAIFPFFLFLSSAYEAFAYIAYFFYGISQGGSHLVWHVSGPIFADNKESSKYSGVNLVMVGMRGMIAPFLGGMLYNLFGATLVFALGGGLCLSAALYMKWGALKKLSLTQ